LRQELANVRAELTQMQSSAARLADLREYVSRLRAQLSQQAADESSVARLSEDLQKVRAKHDALQAEHRRAVEDSKRLQSQLDGLGHRYADAVKALEEARNEGAKRLEEANAAWVVERQALEAQRLQEQQAALEDRERQLHERSAKLEADYRQADQARET